MKTKFCKVLKNIFAVFVLAALISLSALAASVVSLINLTVDEPVPGQTPLDQASLPDTASTRVVSVKWSPDDKTFKKNTDYTVTAVIAIKSDVNRVFVKDVTKMTVKVNGVKTADVEKSGDNVVVRYTWKAGSSTGSTKNNANSGTGTKTNTNTNTNTNTKTDTAKNNQTKMISFSDVKDSAYYADAVKWAVEKSITAGTSATTFSPDNTCTRAQILTFLWRAVGSPKRFGFIIFDDVKADEYFYEPAMWAKDHEMVSGRNFEPDTPCTRAATVVYLWKNAGSPETAVTGVFTDVDANAEYAQAVAWAVKNGVTSGTSATTFSPDLTCTRGQIVTFLKRAMSVSQSSTGADNSNDSQTPAEDSDDSAVKQPDKTDDTSKTEKPEKTDDTSKNDTSKTDDTSKSDTNTGNDKTEKNDDSAKYDDKYEVILIKTKYDEAVYDAAAKKALREALGDDLGKNMSDFKKALLIHDWLVNNCMYNVPMNGKYDYCEYGPIVEGKAVCSGYARAYNDLLSRVGIKAEFVTGMYLGTGETTAQRHAWSVVTIDGKKYHVDVTADDPTPDSFGKVSRLFFMISDAKLRGHSDYTVHCTDTKYENYDLLGWYYMPFYRTGNDDEFYYIDMDKVKTTTDFTETLIKQDGKNGFKAANSLMTDDGKYICFFKPESLTSVYPLYLYSTETGEYYRYTVRDVKDIVSCTLRQKGNNIQVIREYYKNGMPIEPKAVATIPIPESSEARAVTFDQNYAGGKKINCVYLNEYWTKDDVKNKDPVRNGYTFDGWYTEKYGGTKIESLEDVKDDGATLYAHWWGKWSITKEPTLTEGGKAERELDGAPDIKEEVELPDLEDTSVWKMTRNISSTVTFSGIKVYSSVYGDVTVRLPLKKPEYKYGIEYRKNNIYITVTEGGVYTLGFEAVENGETVSTAKIKVTTTQPGESVVVYPKSFTPTGTVTATLYDSDMNFICSTEYQVD